MPSCDVILRPAPSCSQAPPPRATLLTLCDSPGATKDLLKRPFIKCIVKVLKRTSGQDTGDQVSKKPREDIPTGVTLAKNTRYVGPFCGWLCMHQTSLWKVPDCHR
ncbi:hypothetical protein AVEN_2391-1 [Araneus ventricosus]|uniref:Uncharacterized protein n=1 Tax=Araneus ventricosus TaxID=182803 RepID=A0A4Y2VF17_ARAVE|nr:hypothetical protein AVEN_2391-1 [Araneus ventricosus]